MTQQAEPSAVETVAVFAATVVSYQAWASLAVHGEQPAAIMLLAWASGHAVVIWIKGLWRLIVMARTIVHRLRRRG